MIGIDKTTMNSIDFSILSNFAINCKMMEVYESSVSLAFVSIDTILVLSSKVTQAGIPLSITKL